MLYRLLVYVSKGKIHNLILMIAEISIYFEAMINPFEPENSTARLLAYSKELKGFLEWLNINLPEVAQK